MAEENPMICPVCGVAMNHHADKIDYNAALEDPTARSLMATNGAEPLGGSSEAFSQFVRREVRKYAGVAKEAGIRAQ